MFFILSTTGALIAAGIAAAGATAGAAGSAYNRKKAQNEEKRAYKSAQDYLTSQYYRDPLTTVGNRSLIKAAKEAHEDDLEALQNRAIAGGATMENALQARQKSNESMDKLYGSLLKSEDARRDAIGQQQLRLDQQHSANIQNGFLQSAQDWQSWGASVANAAMSYGSSQLLGGYGGAAGDVAGDALKGMASRTDWELSGLNQGVKGLNPVQKIRVNNVNNGLVTVPNTGGLKR